MLFILTQGWSGSFTITAENWSAKPYQMQDTKLLQQPKNCIVETTDRLPLSRKMLMVFIYELEVIMLLNYMVSSAVSLSRNGSWLHFSLI